MIQFTCSGCQAKFKVADDQAGQKGKCPKCGAGIEIPSSFTASVRTEGRQATTPPAEDLLRSPDTNDDSGEIPLADESVEKAPAPARRQSAPAPAKGLVITTFQDIAVVDLQHNSILDGLVIDGIGKDLYALVDEQARRKIILDFAKVRFMSSQMLGVIINLHKKSVAIKGQVVLCGLNSELLKVFTIMKLDTMVRIVADEKAAMGVFGFRGA